MTPFKGSLVGSVLFLAGLMLGCPAPSRAQNLVTNPGFETPDTAAPTIKPLGWFRRSFGALTPNTTAQTDPWRYSDTIAHSGTHSVGIVGPIPSDAGGIVSWDMEGGTPANTNADNRGQGPNIDTTPGAVYRIQAWVKKSSATGTARLRIRDTSANDASSLVGSGYAIDFTGPSTDWTLLSVDYPAQAEWMNVKLYATGNLAAGESIFWDDISVTLIASPQTFSGIVRKTSGDPVAGAVVGVKPAGRGGLDNPEGFAITGADGRFTVSVAKAPGDYVAQAWLPDDNNDPPEGYLASASVPLQPSGTDTVITYDPVALNDVLATKPIIAVSSKEPDFGFWPIATNDNNIGSRWSSSGGDAGEFPHFIVYDMGAPVEFGTAIKQFEFWWETARPDQIQLRVSNTPPDPAMYNPQSAANTALALNYGTIIYDSGTGGGFNNALLYGDHYVDVVQNVTPATGRYLMVLFNRPFSFFTNVSSYEIKVQALPATITGRVVNAANAPVEGARVMYGPGWISVATTDASGNYTIPGGQGVPVTLYAHTPTAEATDVLPVAGPISVTPSGATATAPDITLPAAVPNLVPANADADAYLASAPGTNNNLTPPEGAVDRAFFVDWTTAQMPNERIAANGFVPPINQTSPFYFIVDLGSAQTFNQIIAWWSEHWPGAYRIEVADTYDMANRTGGNWRTAAIHNLVPTAYEATEIGYYADIVQFPTTTARYIRIVMFEMESPQAVAGMAELQVALVPVPIPPLGLASQALKVAGGLEAVTDQATFTSLNAAGGTTIDIADAVALAREGK